MELFGQERGELRVIFVVVRLFWQVSKVDLIIETSESTIHAPEKNWLLNS